MRSALDVLQQIMAITEAAMDALNRTMDVEKVRIILQQREPLIGELSSLIRPDHAAPAVVSASKALFELDGQLEMKLVTLEADLASEIKRIEKAKDALSQWRRSAGVPDLPDRLDFQS